MKWNPILLEIDFCFTQIILSAMPYNTLMNKFLYIGVTRENKKVNIIKNHDTFVFSLIKKTSQLLYLDTMNIYSICALLPKMDQEKLALVRSAS